MKKYQSALITGASSGLGKEFANQIAPNAKELILVARRADKLETLKQSLLSEFPDLIIHCDATDLNNLDQTSNLISKIETEIYCPDLLVNCAGMGDLGSFKYSEWPKLHAMMNLNIIALTRLTWAVIPSMKKHKKGFIIQVSSLAGTLPIPDFSVYAATKAYVTSFSEALRLELKEENINVTALCPGPVHTEFGDLAERKITSEEFDMRSWSYVTPSLCIKSALKAVNSNKPVTYPGFHIKCSAIIIRLTPMPILRLIMGRRPRKVD